MIPEENEPVVPMGIDDTPTIVDQARAKGWEAATFSFGKAEDANTAFFNPGLVERDDGLWLMVRRSVFEHALDFGKNNIWACKLNPDMTPHGGKFLTFPNSDHREQFEDARCIKFGNRVFVAACNFIWWGDGSWTGAHQVIADFAIDYNDPEQDWAGLNRYDLEIEGNGRSLQERTRHQKNWCPFIHEGRLHIHYSTKPWTIIAFNQRNMADMTTHKQPEGVEWAYGTMRGGTPPVLIDDLFWTFNHSSLPWTGRYRKYFMGAVAFEAKPPFKPIYYTPEPLLAGSQKDYWTDRKPLVVFPGGSVYHDGMWTIVYGINDLRCGYVKMPHSDLIKLCKPVPDTFMGLSTIHHPTTGPNEGFIRKGGMLSDERCSPIEPKVEKTDEEERFDVKVSDPTMVDMAIREVQGVMDSEETKAKILKAIIATPIKSSLNGQNLAAGHGEQQKSPSALPDLRGSGDALPKPGSHPISVEEKKNKLRANAAKAREALAKKRELQKNLRDK